MMNNVFQYFPGVPNLNVQFVQQFACFHNKSNIEKIYK